MDRFPADLKVAKGVRIFITDGGQASFSLGSSIDNQATIVVKQGKLVLGAGAYIGIGALICARDSISIGNNVLIAEYVTIRDQDHDFGPGKITSKAGFSTAAIVIGNNVWLGAKVTVTKGVSIGDNSIIGANSVVTRDIPANVIAAGVPARIVREI
jgi:acetyltransferase-like isoleucine patch superfamily enzyme